MKNENVTDGKAGPPLIAAFILWQNIAASVPSGRHLELPNRLQQFIGKGCRLPCR
jgi:hypothetical protein